VSPSPRPILRSVLLTAITAAAAGAALVWRSEALRQAAHASLVETRLEAGRRALDEALADAARTRAERDAARAEAEARAARIGFLERELGGALRRAEAVSAAVEAERAELQRVRAELDARRIAAGRPMPEGLRLALETLADQLRADGHPGLRFVHARALEEQILREVELVEVGAGGGRVTYYRAGALSVELDRGSGVLLLRLRDGHALRDGALEPLAEGGTELRFEGVDGPAFERRLPYLVQALGTYPEPEAGASRPEVLDTRTRERWRARLGELLDRAGTEVRYDLGRFRTVRDGRFVDVSLHGYDGRRLLMQSAEAAHLAVEVDRGAGVVSLLLEDGVLRKRGGETTIPKSGYRILLPGVTPQQASDALLGMVVERR
jgi:hypothetical protein